MCIPGLATTSGSDGMDSTLEYMLPGAHGLLWLHSICLGSCPRWQNLAYPCLSNGGKVKAWINLRISSFYVGGPSPSAWSGGALSGTGYMVPQPFSTEGNRSYSEFWTITDDPWYMGY
jgi:hypothetical protein